MNKPKIFIGVPNLGMVDALLSYRLTKWYHSPKYDITLVHVTGVRPLEVALNKILEMFLESDCEYLFTINDDECLPEDALDILLAHDKDIVIPLGLRWANQEGPMPCVGVREGSTDVCTELARHFDEPGEIDATESEPRYVNPTTGYKGLRECDRVGNSGILIKRHVVEALPLGTFRLKMSEDRLRVLATEDYVWCDAMRAKGFKIYVDCSLKLEHYKKVNIYTVKQLMIQDRLAGQGDCIRALETMLAAGAPHAEAVEGIIEWYEQRRQDVFPT